MQDPTCIVNDIRKYIWPVNEMEPCIGDKGKLR